VVGFGRTGRQVALELVAEGAHFVVVENNPDVMEGLRTSGHRFVEGDGAADEVLKAAGIARARALICAGDSDQRNVYIVLTARSMRPDLYIVARAAFADSVPKLERAGADRVVSPYLMAGHRMVEMALRPVVVDVLDNVLRPSETEMGLEELLVRPGSRASGRSLSESGILDQGAMVLALRRAAGDLQVNPPADTAVEEGDLLVAMGTRRQLNSLAGLL
jgi:voltage-gated potassium channel